MPNRYCNLDGSKRISEDYTNINIGFDKVQGEMDTANQSATTHINNADIHVTKAQKTDWDSKAAGNHRHNNATAAADGFQSKEDKAKSDASTSAATPSTLAQRDAVGRLKVAAPAATDDVARKAEVDAVQGDLNTHKADTNIHVTKAKQDDWDSKAPGTHRHDNATPTTDGFMPKEDKTKINGIAAGAEVNQNAFAKVNDIPATGKTDTVTLKAGTGIAITTNPADKSVNITATGQSTPGPHASSHLSDGSDPIPNATTVRSGLMSAQDKQDIDTIKTQINAVQLTKTLGPGANLINADQASALDMTVYGASRTNSLGDVGNCESLTPFGKSSGATLTLDTTNKTQGSNGLKVTTTLANNGYAYIDVTSAIDTNKYYVAIADVKHGSGIDTCLLFRPTNAAVGEVRSASTDTTFKPLAIKIAPSQLVGATSVQLRIEVRTTEIGSFGYADAIRLYEVDAATFDKVNIDPEWSGDKLAERLPYVDKRQHVQGVVITKQGKNSIPSLYDIGWTIYSDAAIKGAYELELNAKVDYTVSKVSIPALPSTTYTISMEHNGRFECQMYSKGVKTSTTNTRSDQSFTFKTDATTDTIQLFLTNIGAGKYTFKNMQIELGEQRTAFVPREDQRILLPVTLGEVGGVRDSVDVRGTEAALTERVKKGFVLDGSFGWGFNASYTGVKRITFIPSPLGIASLLPFLVKYDGKAFANGTSTTNGLADTAQMVAEGNLLLNVSNSESGWTDALNPSANAVKGLLNGWKATANDGSKYTSWVSILSGSAPATNTEAWVAANKAPGWTGWATLDYVLATPVISKVADADGAISLHPGGNMITVESGAIFKEQITFMDGKDGYYYSNSTTPAEYAVTMFKKRVKKIVRIDEGIKAGVPFELSTNSANGTERPKIKSVNYNPKAQYFASYLTLDNYAYSANVTQTDVQYKAGLNGTVSDNTNDIARLKTENDAQNFADTYIQAKTENNALDIKDHKSSTTAHDATAITNSDIINFPGMPKLTDVLSYLKLLASSLKSKVAGAIGAPLSATDTADQMESKIQTMKNDFADNLKAKAVNASGTETLTALIAKVKNIIRGQGNATAADVLAPKTFTGDSGVVQTGTMPYLTGIRIAPAVFKYPDGQLAVHTEKGYQDGGSGGGELKVSVAQMQSLNAYLQPQYILQGAEIFGIAGTLQPTVISPGEGVLLAAADIDSTNQAVWAKRKTFHIGLSGTYRVTFSGLAMGPSAGLCYAVMQIRKNGVPYGPEVWADKPNQEEMWFTQDLYFNAGDTCEIWLRGSGNTDQSYFCRQVQFQLKINGASWYSRP